MSQDHAVRIHRLELEQFRVHQSLVVDIPDAGLRVHGPNGSGKTSLIEAIQLLSTTRPRRGGTDADLVNHDSGTDLGLPPFARVVGTFQRDGSIAKVEAFIQLGERGNSVRKTLKVGDRPRRAADVVGLIPTVAFSPDDLELILGAPSSRRRFLDVLLSQVDRQYLRCLSKYAKILAQRNGLLRRSNDQSTSPPPPEQFTYWDEQLIALGAYIVAIRARTVDGLAASAKEHFSNLSLIGGELAMSYVSSLAGTDAWWKTITRDARDAVDAAQRVGESFERQLLGLRAQEIVRGATLIGPHRDDLLITLGGHDVARFGSRGQQRIAVVAVKLAEIDVIATTVGLRPLFLVDDVLSELDQRNRESLMRSVAEAGSQLVVTSTDASLLEIPALLQASTLGFG